MERVKHPLRVDSSGRSNVTLRQNLTAEDPTVRHPLRRTNEDILFSSCPAGIFDIQREYQIC
jgi:hypothetical protein